LKTLGFEKNIKDNDFTKCLRQEIVKWARRVHHPEYATMFFHKFYQYLDNFEKLP